MVQDLAGMGIYVDAIQSARTSAAWHTQESCSMLKIGGADRVDFLHRISTNDLSRLSVGHGKQTVLVTDKARILDVLTVLQDVDHSFVLTSNEQARAVTTWLRKYVIMEDVSVTDVSSAYGRFDIIGPHASTAIAELLDVDVRDSALCEWRSSSAVPDVFVVRLPSVADVGYAIVGPTANIVEMKATCSSHPETLPFLETEPYEYLRICAGMGKHGSELTEEHNPLEAGLLHLTSFTKGCYIGQEVIARLDSYNKVKQRIMGLRSTHLSVGQGIHADGESIGIVTSVTPSCNGETMLGLGYIRQVHAIEGSSVLVQQADDTMQQASIHLFPMDDTCR